MLYHINITFMEEVLVHYEKNVAIVLDTLTKCQYGKRSIFLTKQCYAEFKDYMTNKVDASFALKKAIAWCETKVVKTYRKQFKNAIYRLADAYEHSRVLGSHLRFYGPLSEYYSKAIDTYKASLSKAEVYSDNSLRRIKEVYTQFCLFLQVNGVHFVNEVDYPILEQYHEYIQESFTTYQELERMVSGFLKYWADNGCCRIGLPLFMYCVGIGKCTSCSSLSPESRIIIEKRRGASIAFPSDEFYNTIPDFTNRLIASGYSEKITHNVIYHLTVLYLFLDREKLGYEKVIVLGWEIPGITFLAIACFVRQDVLLKCMRTMLMKETYLLLIAGSIHLRHTTNCPHGASWNWIASLNQKGKKGGPTEP